jgi:hypothetical protein
MAARYSNRRFLYLHGFASSSSSRKAAYFAERFSETGRTLVCPDFNGPDFSTLTLTRMVDQTSEAIEHGGPVALIGSSLGAVAAIHTAAARRAQVDRLVLLAPAVGFPNDADRAFGGETIARWRATGTLDVFHYGDGMRRPLRYGFLEDARRYDTFATYPTQPMLILQGRRDQTVDGRLVEQYAERAAARLVLLDDDHQLIASLPAIWTEMAAFLDLT